MRSSSPSRPGIVDVHPSTDPEVSGPVHKKKTDVKKFTPKSRVSSGSKHSVAGLYRKLDSNLGKVAGIGVVDDGLSSPSARPTTLKSPISTARKSRRPHDNGESIAARAERRAAAMDAGPAGTPPLFPMFVRFCLLCLMHIFLKLLPIVVLLLTLLWALPLNCNLSRLPRRH